MMQENESTYNPSSDDHETFRFMPGMLDLLVDGELSDKERCQVLQYLEKTKNGWRDCAMAFLESAMFKESLNLESEEEYPPVSWGEITEESRSGKHSPKTDHISPTRNLPDLFNKANLLMVAAGFLFAFLFYGIIFYIIGFPGIPSQNILPNHVLVNKNHGMLPPGPQDQNHQVAPPLFSSKSPLSHTDMQYVTLDSCNPEWKGMQIPCYSAKAVDAKNYLSHTNVLEDEQVKQFLEAGHEVDVTRQNIIMPANDGRKVVIPVDQVNVKFRPQTQYQ